MEGVPRSDEERPGTTEKNQGGCGNCGRNNAQVGKSRPVPFALADQVMVTIEKQVEDGELGPVDQSEWASPTVVVRKNDGSQNKCANCLSRLPISSTGRETGESHLKDGCLNTASVSD